MDRPISETEFQIVKSVAFVAALGLALGLERLRPHGRISESTNVNAALWLVNLVAMGVLCGACACTVARWADARTACSHGARLLAPRVLRRGDPQ